MRRIAITGAAGALGRAVLRLAPPQYELLALDTRVPNDLAGTGAPCTWRELDIRNIDGVLDALQDVDAVLHLAAIPGPRKDQLHTVFEINTMGTWNVCHACERHGIRRLVFISSLCYHGYPYRREVYVPPSLPVDEDSPAVPEDAYSLSKRVGEEIVACSVRRAGIGAVSLRYPWVIHGGAKARHEMAPAAEGAKNFWGYIDGDDAARAVWQSLSWADTHPGQHGPFFITADDTLARLPSRELIARFFPDVPLHPDYAAALAVDPYRALYSNARAKAGLGFQPTIGTWRSETPPAPATP